MAYKRPVVRSKLPGRRTGGQALVEYVLIVMLVVFAIIAILAVTGPSVGNVFSNAVYNLLNQTTTPRATLNDATFWAYASAVASLTPASYQVQTNTPIGEDPLANKPPVCSALANLETPMNTPLPLQLLLACTDPNGDTLRVVSVNPVLETGTTTPGGTLAPNPVPSGVTTFTPVTDREYYASFTYLVGDGRTPELTASGYVQIKVGDPSGGPLNTPTSTPQPSPTPPDVTFSYPFYDRGDTPANWQGGDRSPFSNVVHGPWDVEYFNGPATGAPASTGTHFWAEGRNTLEFDWGTGVPAGGISSPTNYSVRFTANTVPLEVGKFYQMYIVANGYAELTIDGTQRLLIPSDTGANQTSAIVNFQATASSAQFVLTFQQTAGAGLVKFVFNRMVDKGDGINPCRWNFSGIAASGQAYHSEFSSYQDSPLGSNYAINSTCNFRLRGSIPLGVEPARFSFWERWSLRAGAELRVGVRRYTTTEDWTWITVHNTVGTNVNWKRQVYDLSNFGGQNFTNQQIEIAFVVNNPTGNEDDGWYIDDIAVEPNTLRLYKPDEFLDDVENAVASISYWHNECGWARTNFDSHSPNFSWSDSANRNYNPSDDCSLELNGLVDLTELASSQVPQLTFWSKVALGTGDEVRVEWAPNNSDPTGPWTALQPQGSVNTYIARGTSNDWRQEIVNLNATGLPSQFRIRFRLLADSDSSVADGWYIDDIVLRIKVNPLRGIPFYEPFNDTADWLLSGSWGLTTTGTTPTPFDPIQYHSTPTALTDSPAGTPNDLETVVELVPSIILTGTTKPTMYFWTYWEADTSNLLLEISTDEGATWNPTPLWRKQVGGSRPDDAAVQKAWQRFKVDLTPYNAGTIRLRFRMVPTPGVPDTGWYIDDILLEEGYIPPWPARSGTLLNTFSDPAEATYWHAGGKWQTTDEQALDGSADKSFGSNPGSEYLTPARNILEYATPIDMTGLPGSAETTLYFWQQYNLEVDARMYVEVSVDGGYSWPDPADTNPASPTYIGHRLWVNQSPSLVNLGWHRVQISLEPYKTATTPIHIRFVLDTLNSAAGFAGVDWYIDNFQIFDRSALRDFGVTFEDDFSSLGPGSNWVTEGLWTAIPSSDIYGPWQFQVPSLVSTTADYGGGVVTANWLGNYWHTNSGTVWNTSTGNVIAWPTGAPNIGNDTSVGEINFDYAADTANRPFPNTISQWAVAGINNHEWYLMRWQRRFQYVGASGTLRLRLNLAGGGRVFMQSVAAGSPASTSFGSPLSPVTTLPNPFKTVNRPISNPFTRDRDQSSYFFEVNVTSGTYYDIRVEYHHATSCSGSQPCAGPGRVSLTFAEPSAVAHTQPGSTFADKYPDKHRTSIILDGLLTIPANHIGTVGYSERWSLTDVDYARVYVSFDEGFTWVEQTTYTRTPNNAAGATAGSMQDWVNTAFAIQGTNPDGSFAALTRVMIKFEIDTRINTAVDEGWYLDNFQFYASLPAVNTPPTSASVTINTLVNVDASGTVTVVDPTPGDTFTLSILTQPQRGTVAINALGNGFDYDARPESTGSFSFTFLVTDSAGQSVIGFGTINVDPSFSTLSVDVGSNSSININGNTWTRWDTNGWTTNASSTTSDNTINPNPPTDANTTAMLRTFVKTQNTSNPMQVAWEVGSAPDDGDIYSLYIWVVGTETTPQTYDIYFEDTNNHVRLVNDLTIASKGDWQRLGPFSIRTYNGDIYLWTRGGIASIAGIEMYRGAEPDTWTGGDIGGSTVLKGTNTGGGSGPIQITAAGADIWGTADEFRYVFQVDTDPKGSCTAGTEVLELIARVQWNASPPDPFSKVGLMIRDHASEGSDHAAIVLTRDNGLRFQWRDTPGGTSASSPASGISGPIWLRLVKTCNDLISGFYSTDGNSWTQVGSAVSLVINSRYFVGLAVTSHNSSQFADATIDNIQIIRKNP